MQSSTDYPRLVVTATFFSSEHSRGCLHESFDLVDHFFTPRHSRCPCELHSQGNLQTASSV